MISKTTGDVEPELSLIDLMVLSSDGETPELMVAYDMQEYLLRESEASTDNADDVSEDPKEAASVDQNDSFIQRNVQVKSLREASKQDESKQKMIDFLKQKRREKRGRDLSTLNDDKWRWIQQHFGRCSALVKVTDDDIYVGHTTFSDFSEMTRVFKFYDFPLPGVASRKLGFSSYPGIAGSTDDYYLMDTGLVVTETTISMLTDEVL